MKKIIYTLAKAFFYVFTTFFCFVAISSILAYLKYSFGWNIPYIEISERKGQDFAFFSIPFIKMGVGFNFRFIAVVMMWISLLFYSIYFYTLKEFFKIFTESEVFNAKSLKKLRVFFYINLIPIAYAIVTSIYELTKNGKIHFDEDQFVPIFHLFIALLVYLYMDILKKGKVLQEENELTI